MVEAIIGLFGSILLITVIFKLGIAVLKGSCKFVDTLTKGIGSGIEGGVSKLQKKLGQKDDDEE